ncbi:MAG: STAS-like domain-containing protein [Defluviitaleaceae bacterium]|nr:STAS-like domain-containing protein [Defluviitaleaceae bacterium]
MSESIKNSSNYIVFENDWNHPRAVSEFLRKANNALKMGYTAITLDLNNIRSVYPSVCTPIAGIAQYYNLKKGITFNYIYPDNHFLKRTFLENPYRVSEHKDSLAFPLNKIWRFSNIEEITLLIDVYLTELRNTDVFKLGVLDGLTWSLNETMDNVLQHSLCDEGFIMGVIRNRSKIVSFNIFDYGQGIYNSLRNSEFHPRTPIDAISIAIQEGKTRDRSIGQGNGLWGLSSIININRGNLRITSHGASLLILPNAKQSKHERLPVINFSEPSTSIEFVLNYNTPISISEALGGYKPLNIHLENLENAEGDIVFKLSEQTSGFGTRIAGERVRNNIINLIEEVNASSLICVDFSNISIISSSFADEFIGKLLTILGFFKFTRLIVLKNMNETIETIINRSVGQRMATTYSTAVVEDAVEDF